jgi:hypothetical protein
MRECAGIYLRWLRVWWAETAQMQGYHFIADAPACGGGQGGELSSPRSFSWPDAGIGFGVAAGSIFCLFGGALALAGRRGRLAV